MEAIASLEMLAKEKAKECLQLAEESAANLNLYDKLIVDLEIHLFKYLLQ